MKNEDVEIAGVRLTHPDKILYPDQGLTKRELAEYLEVVAKPMLVFAAGHPLSLVRCPQGIGGKCFYQKHSTGTLPDGFKSILIREKDGDEAGYLYVDTVAGIVAAAQIGALELHLWGAPADDLEHPDRLVFDLDPAEDVGFAEVKAAASDLRAVLDAAGLRSFAMLTGGKGIHVIAPLDGRNGWADVKAFAEGLARGFAEREPGRFIATASKARRRGRIFIDWLRNERGATAIAPYSPRARKGAPVTTPVSWRELSRLRSASAFSTVAIVKRLKRQENDPWPGYRTRQHIGKETLKTLAA
ncbi:non-homologous end-joining DNA ligase [Taklimakanibacter lacteus]|uniref:non-homologous end-joining DNA ligase n=1 Tax=Taklimakanibacter lacteus TaxID=2268456 RepID=UPI000E66C342